MTGRNILEAGDYQAPWVRDFYDAARVWWGDNAGDDGIEEQRAAIVERLCRPGRKRVLELGAGSGATARRMAELGHDVVAIDLSSWIRSASAAGPVAGGGSLRLVEGDYLVEKIDGRFDLVADWDGFGIGTDDENHALLARIGREWLAPGGAALVDVASPFYAYGTHGKREILDPLDDVPGSVEMDHRCSFDPVACRWVDRWIPTADPSAERVQSVRSYTPADFRLLLRGTGLRLDYAECDGVPLAAGHAVTIGGPLMTAYSYLVRLVQES